MYYLLIILYIVLSIITIAYLNKISDTLNTPNNKKKANNKKNTRIHSAISQSNYDNSFGGRKAYKKYQNNDGLYEPLQPSKGINLKKEA